ncbi:MAG: hypothetical protein JST04_17565 [Bdellovibrionales bacterium]|nr:hypothetical protein [Bdellovibrionales bacterium]
MNQNHRPLRLSLLATCLMVAPLFARADDLRSKCPDLEKCAHAVAELTGAKFVYDSGMLKDAIASTKNFDLTKGNADEVFTLMLNQNGFTRMPLAEANAFTILRQRDARDSALPTLVADAKTTPDFPKTWDLANLRYKLVQPELAEHICQNIRAFMPANSRVVPDDVSGQIFLVAPYPILANALKAIQSMDVKISAEKMRQITGRGRKHREERGPPRPEGSGNAGGPPPGPPNGEPASRH